MKNLIPLAFGATLIPVAAYAAVSGSVSTDLNLRTGPGSNYSVIATVPAGAPVVIESCIEGASWCQVTFDGRTGYAFSTYLLVDVGGQTIVVAEDPSLVDVVTAPVEAIGEATGSVIGALGNAVGGVVGGVASAFTPEPEVVTYVRTNPVDTIYLDGEVVRGAVVPEAVTLREVPSSEYRYAYINGEPVLVEPGTRQIVYVYR